MKPDSRVGRRGLSLLFFGLLDVVYAASLVAPDEESRKGAFLTAIALAIPLWGWALLWFITGLLCLFFAFQRNDRVGFSAAIFLKITWGITCLCAWLFAGVDRGYVSAAIWLALAGFVWVLSGWPESGEGRRARWIPPSG